MYRCCECGNLFEEGEQAVWYENQGECHGVTAMERFSGCPLCHGDYEEIYQCKECGDWHSEDELYDGWCEKCLRNTINYSTFFEYCEAHKEEQYLDTFVMYYILNCEYVPKISSHEFHELMVRVYNDRVEQIKRYKAMPDGKLAGVRCGRESDPLCKINVRCKQWKRRWQERFTSRWKSEKRTALPTFPA